MNKTLFVLLLTVLAAPALAIDVNNPPQGVFADEWYAVMMAGTKSGHMHNTMERAKRNGRDVIKTTNTMTMVAGRGDTPITVTLKQQTEESLTGEPLRFSNRMSLGKIPVETTGTFSEGKVTIVEKQLGLAGEKKTYDLPKGALMSWGLYREEMARGLKPNTKYTLSLYDPSVAPNKLITAKVEIFDKEKIDLFGRKVEAIKTRQTIRMPALIGKEMDMPTTIWVSEEGDTLRMETKVMDIPVEMIACPKTMALSKNNPADLMSRTLITVNKPLDRNADQLTFRLEWDAPAKDEPADVPATGMQKIVKQDGHTAVTITNTRYSARQKAGSKPTPLSKADQERYTAVTSVLNYKDPEVARLAREAAGSEKDPLKLAHKLREFVSDYVKTKDLSVGFGSASEVARSKEGDCTEHGVLLAALGRAVGLPTRVAAGFVYADEFLGHDKVFVGHMWTQFYIDGQWVDIDAALHQNDVDPTHIALAVSDAGDNGVADLAGSIWMGKPKISVIPEVTDKPEK